MPQTSLSAAAEGPLPVSARILSLGFMPQTSLSGIDRPADRHPPTPVSGVHAPDFVERRRGWKRPPTSGALSLGFMPQTSLSGVPPERHRLGGVLSLGFMPQTSLSVRNRSSLSWNTSELSLGFMPQTSLSGPAFGSPLAPPVNLSLGFMPQTSLSGPLPVSGRIGTICLWGSCPRLR